MAVVTLIHFWIPEPNRDGQHSLAGAADEEFSEGDDVRNGRGEREG